MSFIDQWRAQLDDSLVECAKLVAANPGDDLKYQLLVVGVLWPLRRPIQDFNLEAMEATQEIVGERAKFVFQLVQQWQDDPLAVAQQLSRQELSSGDLGAAINKIIAHFGAFPIFARQIAPKPDAAKPKPAAETAPTEPSMKLPRVLVSYTPGDGKELADELFQKLKAEGIATWRDLSQLEGQRNWWQQIMQALNQVDFLVLAMTPAATTSEWVRKQWRYARQQGVCIYPVLKDTNLDFMALPRWIRQIHFYNLNLEWAKLINDLKGECKRPRVPFMVEDLPADFVTRPAELNQLLSHFYNAQRDEAIAGTVGLYGAGGYGKSMLAAAVGHNENIRQVFDNGILWVTLSENPGDLSRHVIDLIEVLSGERPGFAGLDAAVGRLGELLADRDILMVIDDVWNAAHLKPFLQGGRRCARLITTRHITVLPPEAKLIKVGAMQPEEAVALLGSNLPQEQREQTRQLATRLGEWPLLLKLANGTLRDRVHKNRQTLAQALDYVTQAFDKQGLTAFDSESATARDQAVSQTIEVSLELLNEEERTRYFELAIFPEDVNIPLAALEKLWGATGGFDDFDTEELCDHLHELSLIAHFDLAGRYIRLHKMMRRYLAYQQSDKLPALHNQFLDAQFAPLKQWAGMPPDEPYLWAYLAYHLVQAGRTQELLDTVTDLNYLAAKAYARGIHYAESDLRAAEEVFPNDNTLRPLRRTLSQTSHLLVRCGSVRQIANTLHSRLLHNPNVSGIATKAEPTLPRPLLTARHMLPDLPESNLIRTLRGPTAGLLSCAASGDGSTIAAIAKDNTLTVWDAETGTEQFNLAQPDADLWGCDISANGTTVVCTTSDGRLTLWDIPTKSQGLSWLGHETGAIDCAISADAGVVVSASKDKTLKVWDAKSGAERFTLTGHQRSVTCCDISADGSVIASSSNDGTLRIWDATTGAERFMLTVRMAGAGLDRLTFSSQRDVRFNCAISANGAVAAATSSVGTLTVWDATTGAERFSLHVDKRGVQGCALNADGSVAACALTDGTLKVWNTATGTELLTLSDHTRAANDCAMSSDGSLIISASDDQTLKVWDGRSNAAQLPPVQRMGSAHSCAISADGTVAVSAMDNKTLVVWDVATGTERVTLKGHTRKVNDCAISPDGSTVVSASQDQTLVVWNAQTGARQQVLAGHTWAVNGCAVNTNGTIVASASDDKSVKVWEARTGREIVSIKAHARAVNSCVISGDGNVVGSASGDGLLKLWDAKTGDRLASLKGHTAWVNKCAISADGRTIVSASYDKTLKVWDAAGHTERATLEGHSLTVAGCATSADGSLVVSASRDKTLKVWDAATGACLTTLFVDEPLLDCACSADAAAIVAVGNSGVYFLRLER